MTASLFSNPNLKAYCMSKTTDVAQVIENKVSELYNSGNAARIAVFEALQLEKAVERGESPAQAVTEIDALRRMGAALSTEELANARSSNKTVELKAVEQSIEENLAASGQSPEQRAMTLGVLKQIGALIAGGGVSQEPGDTITPPAITPNVAARVNGRGI